MEPISQPQIMPASPTPVLGVCQVCHQPLLPQYYFCPNCGTKIDSAPLSTTQAAQLKLYAFSLILPAICFLFVGRWQGMKYYRSSDPKTKQIGMIAWAIIIISTLVTIWIAYVTTEALIQSSLASVNMDMSGY